MKRYIVTTSVPLAIGTQAWEVLAESQEDAKRRWEAGEASFLHEELEVQHCEFVSAEEQPQ